MTTRTRCLVVRHCKVTFNSVPLDLWPGKELFIYEKVSENPGEYLIGAPDGSRPIISVPRNVVLSDKFDVKGERYFITRVLTSLRMEMTGSKSGEIRNAHIRENFPPGMRDAKDPIEEVQKYGYAYFPAIGMYMPLLTDADLDK